MKKFLVSFLLLFVLVIPVSAQFDDIQEDQVRINEITTSFPPAGGSAPPRDFSNTEHIQSFQSEVNINKDGTIDVKETIVYDFGNLSRHGIYRDINYITTNEDGKKYELKFDNFSVTDNFGDPYKFVESWRDGQYVRLKIGDANRTVTGIHKYVISYRVSGALTYFSDHDELYWNVTGNGWDVPIAFARAVITLPEKLTEGVNLKCFTGGYGSTQSDCQFNKVQGVLVFDTKNYLMANSGISVVVGFPKNIVAVLEAKEFVAFFDTLLGRLVAWLLGLLALTWYVGLPGYIIFKWFRQGRDPSAGSGQVPGQGPGVVTAWYDPPKTPDGSRFLTPGEVGTLGDETVDMKDISSTIIDLARRGYLKIEERNKGDFYLIKSHLERSERSSPDDKSGRNASLDFSPSARNDNKLLSFEKTLLDKFFKSKKEIRLKGENLASEVQEVTNAIYENIVNIKLFPKNPQSIRIGYYVLAGIALFTGNFFLAIVAFVFGRVMPRKTIEGVNAYNVAKSLKNFLTTQQRQLEFQADKQMMFEKLLPFAIAFGVERIWAKRFESMNITTPLWYQSYDRGRFNSVIFVNHMNSSMKSFATAATPVRSSTGHSSGFSGGFSGGGGGGGGGGSW